MGVTAMFPLGTVLLPGAVLPLHVFESRYRQMMHDLMSDTSSPPQFGVVLIERGHEVGGGEARNAVGTLAQIADVRTTPDGRWGVIAVGRQRFRVNSWLPDDPYPLADIDLWPEQPTEGAAGEALRSRVEHVDRRVRALVDAARSGTPASPLPVAEIDDDLTMAVYALGALAPLGPVDRYRMLAAPDLASRIDALEEALDDAEAVLRFSRS